ncbi:MAG: YtxH domain-containing protein [Chloroflexi bacterium]|nr:YtxH domain-containing protein [Chloroflexota bacterium]
MASDSAKALGIGLLAGIVIGGALGMLYAPKSGAEMRAEMREKAEELREKAGELREKAGELREKAAKAGSAVASRIRRGDGSKEEEIVEQEAY